MHSIVLSDLAKLDANKIWDFTVHTWGLDQAQAYTRGLSAAIARLAENPLLGSDRSNVRPRYRKLNVGSHAIFYRHDDDVLEVVRVLHARMDPKFALRD